MARLSLDAFGERSTTLRGRLPTSVLPPLAVLVVAVVAWNAAADTAPSIILPTPAEVATALVTNFEAIAVAAGVSALTAAIGLAVGTVVGLALAFLTVSSSNGQAVVQPTVIAFRVAPLTAIAPIVFLWFGTGLGVRAVLVATMTVFPVTIASVDGLQSTPETYLDMMDSVGASPLRTFVSVRVPAALPSVFAGFKLAAALAVTGTVVAELLTLQRGLGARIFEASQFLRTPTLFADLAVLAVLGAGFYGTAALAERVASRRWGQT